MTFLEAAIELLRQAGKPLSYKELTELAVKRDMLTQVGRTPEFRHLRFSAFSFRFGL
jgi:hypothetical protein